MVKVIVMMVMMTKTIKFSCQFRCARFQRPQASGNTTLRTFAVPPESLSVTQRPLTNARICAETAASRWSGGRLEVDIAMSAKTLQTSKNTPTPTTAPTHPIFTSRFKHRPCGFRRGYYNNLIHHHHFYYRCHRHHQLHCLLPNPSITETIEQLTAGHAQFCGTVPQI